MREWIKYTIGNSTDKAEVKPQDSSFAGHAKAMGGYDADEAYKNKNVFFQKYYHGYHDGRLENYDKFLRKHIQKLDKVLFVGSGRSANELKLLEEEYNVVASDLSWLSSYDVTKKLFPNYKFFVFNVLKNFTDQQYDGIVSLSLVYLFNNKQFDAFFCNISKSLKNNGYLILDSAGSPDNLVSYFIHDIVLKYETILLKAFKKVKSLGKMKCGLIMQNFGYRRNDADIINAAQKYGFKLIDQNKYALLTEFKRSVVLRCLLKIRFMQKIFLIIGEYVPYTRMYLFRKIEN